MPLRLELHLLLLPSLAEAVECSGDAGEEAWEVWEEWAWEDQAWQEQVWEEWAWEVVWEPDAVEWVEGVEGEVSGTGSGREELQVPGLVQPSRR